MPSWMFRCRVVPSFCQLCFGYRNKGKGMWLWESAFGWPSGIFAVTGHCKTPSPRLTCGFALWPLPPVGLYLFVFLYRKWWVVLFFLRLKTLRTKTRFSWFPCFVNTGAICKVAGMKSNRCSEGFLVVKRKPLFEYRLLEDQDAFDILWLVASQ